MNFLPIEEYMTKSLEERREHLDLCEACIEIGGMSKDFRGLLAHYLKTTIPKGHGSNCLHACHNALCSNPRHLYWGTKIENKRDDIANRGWKSPMEFYREKHGDEKLKELRREMSKKGGEASRRAYSRTVRTSD